MSSFKKGGILTAASLFEVMHELAANGSQAMELLDDRSRIRA